MIQLILSAVVFAAVVLEVLVHLSRGNIESPLGFLVACFFIAMFYLLFRISLKEYREERAKKNQDNLFSDTDRWDSQ